MKLNFHSRALLLLLLVLISSSVTSGRLIASKQEQEVKLKEITSGVSIVETEGNNPFNELMGMEECDNGDEDCLKRRIVSEAHLDYIYTQHHKP